MNTSIVIYNCTIGDIDNAPSPDPAELIPIAAALRLVNLYISIFSFSNISIIMLQKLDLTTAE